MRKTGTLLTMMFAVILSLLLPSMKADAATTFPDVPEGHWAQDAIYHFSEQGVINGHTDGKFHPQDMITRAQAAIILSGVLELDTDAVSELDYQDVQKDYYAYEEIAAVTDKGIMQGYNKEFNPGESLTRAEMAVILTRVFGFESNEDAPFTDVADGHWAYSAISALYTNGVTTGYPDDTFKPSGETSRAEFAVFLQKAVDTTEEDENGESVTALLKEIYANELEIDAYEFEGNMDFGLELPESLLTTEEDIALAEMLSNIQVDITGAYQLDPLLMDATMELTLQGDMGIILPIDMVMSEDTMWMKLPQIPGDPVSEELAGKYIEFDMNELAEMEGQPAASMDWDLQTELAVALNNLMFDYFAEDFYEIVDVETVAVPEHIDGKQAFKFELTNENLPTFFETLMKQFLPGFLELLSENPEYATALGIPQEEIELIKAELPAMNESLDLIVSEINNVLSINTFESNTVVNQDNFINYSDAKMDIDFHVEDDTFGFNLFFDEARENINGNVSIEIPTDVISFEELIALEEELMAELEQEASELENAQ